MPNAVIPFNSPGAPNYQPLGFPVPGPLGTDAAAYNLATATAANAGSKGGAISVGRAVAVADDGLQYDITTALTVTVPAGLSPRPSVIFDCPPTGNLTITATGGALLNGTANGSVTRTRANNPGGVLVQAHADADSYGVTGS